MRVIAGEFKGRGIIGPSDLQIRPTTDFLKEKLFNILSNIQIKTGFLDMCSGTGAIGIEAISRGWENVVFADESNDSIQLIKQNLNNINLHNSNGRALVLNGDVNRVTKMLKINDTKFNIIFIDPPYDQAQVFIKRKVLSHMKELLLEDGQIIFQHSAQHFKKNNEIDGYIVSRRVKAGKSVLTFLRFENQFTTGINYE